MTIRVHRLPEAVCEPEGQATDLPASHGHRIVGQAVLVHNHVIEWNLAGYAAHDV